MEIITVPSSNRDQNCDHHQRRGAHNTKNKTRWGRDKSRSRIRAEEEKGRWQHVKSDRGQPPRWPIRKGVAADNVKHKPQELSGIKNSSSLHCLPPACPPEDMSVKHVCGDLLGQLGAVRGGLLTCSVLKGLSTLCDTDHLWAPSSLRCTTSI